MADNPDTDEALDLGPARSEPMTALAMGDLHLLEAFEAGVRLKMQLVIVFSLQQSGCVVVDRFGLVQLNGQHRQLPANVGWPTFGLVVGVGLGGRRENS